MQQTLGFYSKLEKYSMHQLLNYKESYQAAKRMLCEFCADWRKKRKEENDNAGTHGGITANHRSLIEAILRILPVSFDWIKQNRPGIFKKCLEANQLAIMTTSKALRVKMVQRQDDDDTEENDLVGRSTLFNLLDRLQEAGIIVSREPVRNPTGGKLKSMLIYLNMSAIALFEPSDELDGSGEQAPADGPGGAPDDNSSFLDYYNKNIQSNDKINNDSGIVEKVQPIGCEPPISENLVRSEAVSKCSVQTKENFAAAPTPSALLWKTCEQLLYPGRYFNIGTRTAAIDMLEAHLLAAKSYVEALRSDAIAAFCQTEKYLKKNEAQRSWYLNEFFIKKCLPSALKNAEKTAFGLVYEAIRMQCQAAERYGYETYYPTVFFAEDYGLKKYLALCQNDLAKGCMAGLVKQSEQIQVKNTLRGWLTGFAWSRMRDGVKFAVSRVDFYIKKAEELLRDCTFNDDLKLSYYQYFRTQILALL